MQKMTSVIYLANASSPHVRHWIEFLDEMNMPYHIYSIHKNTFFSDDKVTVKYNFLTRFGGGGAILAYFFLGLWLRFFTRKSILHAHNTSGYGLSALLSGKPYIVTTYGTEIFGADKRSSLYRLLINKVLSKAKKITTTSQQMEQVLVSKFHINSKNILTFGMGVSQHFSFSNDKREKVRAKLDIPSDALVWIYNRRIMPLYNTIEVVQAFKKYSKDRPNTYLILMAGDHQASYTQLVKNELENSSNIFLVEGFLDPKDMSAYLSASDISISVPNSDQLSSSILEAIACGCYPILANLPAYDEILEYVTCLSIDRSNLVRGFEQSANQVLEQNSQLRSQLLEQYKATPWSRETVIALLNQVYAQ
ncbi:glycosyltransferase [Acinetobacter tjernbergiae]|nr:glycosyltransferase [Acinetobacter tjernbergiae]